MEERRVLFLFPLFSDTRSIGLKKTKGLTFTIHKFWRNRVPGSEAAGAEEYKVLVTCWRLKEECQRQIQTVKTECPREVSGSRSFAAWIRYVVCCEPAEMPGPTHVWRLKGKMLFVLIEDYDSTGLGKEPEVIMRLPLNPRCSTDTQEPSVWKSSRFGLMFLLLSF